MLLTRPAFATRYDVAGKILEYASNCSETLGFANCFGKELAKRADTRTLQAARGVLDGLFAARMMAGQAVEEGGRETTRLQLKRLSHLDGLRFLAQLWILAAENLYIGWCVRLSRKVALHLWSASIAQCFIRMRHRPA